MRQAQESFTEAATKERWCGLTVRPAVDKAVRDLEDKIGQLSRFNYSTADSDKVAGVEQGIGKLTAVAEQLAVLAPAFTKLEVAAAGLARRATPLPTTHEVHEGAPPLADKAQPLLELGEIDLDRLATLVSSDIPEMLTLIADWQERELELSGYVRAIQSIDKQTVPKCSGSTTTTPWPRCRASGTCSGTSLRVPTSRSSSWTASSGRCTSTCRTSRGARKRYAARCRTCSWTSSLGSSFQPVLYSLRRGRGITLHRAARILPRDAALLDGVTPTGDTVEHVRMSARLWEYVALALGFVIALVTGFEALYFGEAWGTWLDYADALLWALVTSSVLALLLVPALDQLAKLSTPGPARQPR